MSELRNKLDQAKANHLAARYPGDLAAEVLPEHTRRLSRRILFVGGLTASAMAAGIAVMILLHHPVVGPTQSTPSAVEFVSHVPPAKPDMPTGIQVVPEYQSLTSAPAKPSFPSRFTDL